MKNNNMQGLRFLLCVGFCVIMGLVLIGVSHVTLQAAAFEEELVAPVQEIASELPVLPAPEAPAMPYPYSVEGLAQEQKEREERYASQKQLRRQEVQKRRELRNRMQEEEYKEGGEGEEKQRGEGVGQKGRTQAVLCFLDDSEILIGKQVRAITFNAIAAMVAEQPIVISGSLLAHLFNENGNHLNDAKAVVKAFYDAFDSRNWVVKEVDSNLFLLVPIKNFSKAEIEQLLISELGDGETSYLEYKLGLRVNHMQTFGLDVADKNGIQDYFKERYGQFLTNARQNTQISSEQFVEAVLQNRLFVSMLQEEYRLDRLNRLDLIPEMAIYLAGHGGYNYSIADISIDTTNKLERSLFQRVLDYFATKIKTKLVVVFSCYAAGFNAQKVLSELKEGGSTKIHPFHLVILATGDVHTSLAKPAIDIDLQPTIYFDTFIQEAKGDLGDFDQIKRTILSLITDLKVDIIPQWRPAKSALWIPLVVDDKSVIRIGKVMAATRKEPLLIAPYEDVQGKKHDPQMILLAAENISFDIVIDPAIEKIPAFLSILPGEVTHTIKKLTYEGKEFNVDDFVGRAKFNDFMVGPIEYAVTKKFIIDELVIIKNGQRTTFTEIVIEKKGKLATVIGKQNGIWQNLNAFNVAWEAIKNNRFDNFFVIAEAIPQLSHEEINKVNKKRDYTLLTHAVMSNQPDGVYRALVVKGADVLIQDDYGNTGLHQVCVFGTVQQVEQIFRLEKPDVIAQLINMQGHDGNTALHHLALSDKKFSLDKIKLLLKYGADKTVKNSLGQTPLDMAKLFGSQEAIDFLSSYVQVKEPIKEPVYERAWALMESEDVAAIKLAIQRLSLEEINQINKTYRYTLLTYAVMNNQPDDVYQALLEKGANMLVKNDFGYTQGYTGFHNVCQIGTVDQLAQIIRLEKPEIREKLIMMKNGFGDTPLHLAAGDKKNGLDKIKLLLEYGADPTIKDQFGQTALDKAKLFGNKKVIDFLLASVQVTAEAEAPIEALEEEPVKLAESVRSEEPAKASAFERVWSLMYSQDVPAIKLAIQQLSPEDINKINEKWDYTLLTHSVLCNSSDEVYKALVNKRADIRIQNQIGWTGLNYICFIGTSNGLEQIFRLEKPKIIAQIINKQSNYGQTALHNAAETGKIAMVELLLNSGADKKLKDFFGKTAYDIAKGETEEDTQMLKKLLSDE